MRVSREQAALNRERVLDTAARLFRERGFRGVGVAEVMQEAGLTHGAFYGQFGSKEDLMAEAVVRAYAQLEERWREAARRTPDDPLEGVVSAYVSALHRDRPAEGCVMAALGAEASREGSALRHAITEGTRGQLEALSRLASGQTARARRRRAAASLATMVGALVLARVLDDEALSGEILRAAREAAHAHGHGEPGPAAER
jgi:TetR/AcrR family transcriptional repressor of nem operon